MSTQDYIAIAGIVGQTLAVAALEGGEAHRTEVYDTLYRPLVSYMQRDNDRFDNLRFAGAVGACELAYLSTKAG